MLPPVLSTAVAAGPGEGHGERGRPGGACTQRAPAKVERGGQGPWSGPRGQGQRTAVEIVRPRGSSSIAENEAIGDGIGSARLREASGPQVADVLAIRRREQTAVKIVSSHAAGELAEEYAATVRSARLREAAAARAADVLDNCGEQAAVAEIIRAATPVPEPRTRNRPTVPAELVPPVCTKLPLPRLPTVSFGDHKEPPLRVYVPLPLVPPPRYRFAFSTSSRPTA